MMNKKHALPIGATCSITSYQSSRKTQVLPSITEGSRNFTK